MPRRAPCNFACPAETTLSVLSGTWKVVVLFHLASGTMRFSELRRAMPRASAKVLTQQLRELERDRLVSRKVYPQVPPKVEYSLTAGGKSLLPIVDAMCRWGLKRTR